MVFPFHLSLFYVLTSAVILIVKGRNFLRYMLRFLGCCLLSWFLSLACILLVNLPTERLRQTFHSSELWFETQIKFHQTPLCTPKPKTLYLYLVLTFVLEVIFRPDIRQMQVQNPDVAPKWPLVWPVWVTALFPAGQWQNSVDVKDAFFEPSHFCLCACVVVIVPASSLTDINKCVIRLSQWDTEVLPLNG